MVSTSLLVILCSLFLISFVNGKAEIGAFDTSLREIRQCMGPKRKTCSKVTITIKKNNVASYDVQVIENSSVTKAKITGVNNNKAPVRLQMNKPCEHLFVKPIMKVYFNMTDNCIIPKGKYQFEYDFGELFATYYRGMFIYGNWTFKTMMFGDYCNFWCTEMDVELYPKKST